MDLNEIVDIAVVGARNDLAQLGTSDAVIAGGTWLFSEPQPGIRRLFDITGLGWEPVTVETSGLELAATCTVERVSALSRELPPDWIAAPLLHQCCTALLASYKIWGSATVGGNLCLSFPAGAMISLATALDATVTIWRADGSDRSVAITEFVTGAATNVLETGDVVRSVFLPAAALRARTAFRKIALAPLGRSGAVLVGRLDLPTDGGAFALAVTGSTTRPLSLRFDTVPTPDALDAALDDIPDDVWHEDAHGAPDWRKAVSRVLAHEIRQELS
ncbi:FAD binding domain-containing protein [Antrihabitans sp. YC3-6]|uniref:FAD binding domain-containing protein n=1 Tax=Antrihabitans stalagmiti TaxID=2799499 RepID=A0A934U1C5_9NOCA|nr:FAD binding domain-containing protein [Antrihabitans stalagmiti]MBJ8338012.1 FAD binding domain-containing protein [Antrihabitans stalagmiti]